MDIWLALVALVLFALSPWFVRELWNWLIPSIFGLRQITLEEALGLLLLCKILKA